MTDIYATRESAAVTGLLGGARQSRASPRAWRMSHPRRQHVGALAGHQGEQQARVRVELPAGRPARGAQALRDFCVSPTTGGIDGRQTANESEA